MNSSIKDYCQHFNFFCLMNTNPTQRSHLKPVDLYWNQPPGG